MTASTATTAILVAAGRSERMAIRGSEGESLRKPFLTVAGRTVLEHARSAFESVESVREIIVVAHADDLWRQDSLSRCTKPCRWVSGGRQRTDSVRSGVAAADPASALVAIHDAARPMIAPHTIAAAIEAAAREGAALVAIPLRDTIKHSPDAAHVDQTLDRSVLWSAQTPQVFDRIRFASLLERAHAEGWTPTDDSALWERYLGPVALTAGSPTNWKITTQEDLLLAEALLAQGTRKA
jgi:2-C-methyl-D-erythritol 4-phosphate cytidylyltransferase